MMSLRMNRHLLFFSFVALLLLSCCAITAQPYATIDLDKLKPKLIESYNNIASSLANSDKVKAKEMLNKTLALDPANAYAIEAMKLLK